MNISIGNDHAGVDYKNYIIKNLEEKYNIFNHGTDDINSVDYPDFAHPVSQDINNRKSKIINIVPIKPNSSPIKVKIKSVCFSGKY